MKPLFSVLMSVYRNDRPVYFRSAVESVTIKQTLPPAEVLIVIDGPIPDELRTTVAELAAEIPAIKLVWLEKNGGLGNALRIGMEAVSHELVLRMDSDDISMPDRFEKQIAYLQAHPECDLLGGQITEFIDRESNIVGLRKVACDHSDIIAGMNKRCPFNHVSVAMLRSRVLAVGNYQDWHFNEDYYLWIRMAEAGCHMVNLPDVLVNVRIGKEMYARRGGWKYFKSEKGLQDYMRHHGMLSYPRYIFNVSVRWVVQMMMPGWLRGFVFRKFFRQ